MEHKFEHDLLENQRSWGAYATPPPLPGRQNNQSPQQQSEVTQRTMAVSLCTRVQEMLPPLLENDGSIRPEMATAVRAHLAACPACTREFKAIQRVVTLVEKMPLAEMPMDFSAQIMQRVQAEHKPVAPVAVVKQEASAGQTVKMTVKVVTPPTTQTTQTLLTRTTLLLWQKVMLLGVFAAALAFFVSTEWGQHLLGTKLEVVLSWLGQVADAVRHVPVLGWIANYAFSALAQAGQTLQIAYRTLGAATTQGLALDIALCAGAAFALTMQKQRTHNGRREG